MINSIRNFIQQQFITNNRELLTCNSNSYSIDRPLRDIVIEFFQQEDWTYTVTKNPSILRVACEGKSGKWFCYAKIDEIEQRFAFYSVSPHQASPEKLLNVAEYTSRANYGMTIGNFELDFADGEIRYKTSIDFQDNQPNFGAIAQLVYTNISMMERYLPGILAVIEEDIEPNEAIETIEIKV